MTDYHKIAREGLQALKRILEEALVEAVKTEEAGRKYNWTSVMLEAQDKVAALYKLGVWKRSPLAAMKVTHHSHATALLHEVERLLDRADTTSDAFTEPAPLEDGVLDGSRLRWEEKEYVLPNLPWRLLQFMWDRETASIQDVVDHVWGHDSEMESKHISNLIWRLNTVLAKCDITLPWDLEMPKGTGTLRKKPRQ